MSKPRETRFPGLLARHFVVSVGLIASIAGCALAVRSSLSAPPTPATACPRILFFDGFSPSKSNNETEAKYWGETVGIDGLFLSGIMYTWEDSVGDDENGRAYRMVKDFQQRNIPFSTAQQFNGIKIIRHQRQTSTAATVHLLRCAASLPKRLKSASAISATAFAWSGGSGKRLAIRGQPWPPK